MRIEFLEETLKLLRYVSQIQRISGEIPCLHSVSERESKWLSGLDLAMADDTL